MTPQELSNTPAQVVQGALDLFHAEVKVWLTHLRLSAAEVVVALGAGVVGLLMLQVGVILSVLAPLIMDRLPLGSAIVALALPYVVAVAGGIVAFVFLKRAKERAVGPSRSRASDTAAKADDVKRLGTNSNRSSHYEHDIPAGTYPGGAESNLPSR